MLCASVRRFHFKIVLWIAGGNKTKLHDKKYNFPFVVSSIFEIEDILYQALISLISDKK